MEVREVYTAVALPLVLLLLLLVVESSSDLIHLSFVLGAAL